MNAEQLLDSRSKHERISEILHAEIKAGKVVDRLPSRGELARRFQVNLKTLDKAIGTLEQERIVVPRNGIGVFVHPRLRNQVVSECYFVFPGHKALTDASNESRQVGLHILEQMLNSAHELHAEVKLLAISPLNNEEINWTLLAHLKRDDCVIFLGLQYWNVIQKLSNRGCRCLVLSAHPATQGFASDGMPVMSFDVDYAAMMDTLAEYFDQHGCHHPSLALFESLSNRRFWPPLFKRLSDECRRRGIEFAIRDAVEISDAAGSVTDFCAQAAGQKPAVDAIFTMTDEHARRLRSVLDEQFPAASRSIRMICFDLNHTWRKNELVIDALRKPHGAMVRRLMDVVCGNEPFEPKDVVFPFRLETADGGARVSSK